jgi:hypothetical protein
LVARAGVHESLGTTPITEPNGRITFPGFKYNIHNGIGVVGIGTDLVELDTIMSGLGYFPLKELDYLKDANGILGGFNQDYYKMARELNWIPFMKKI